MPNQDGTGPAGQGPKTGRGMGSCQGQAGVQRGPGRGLGRGRGCCRWQDNDRPRRNQDNNA